MSVLDAVTGACAAVIAGRPPAIFQPDFRQRVSPVLPQEVLVQTGGDVVPGEHFVLFAVTVGVPLQVEAVGLHGVDPLVVIEVF